MLRNYSVLLLSLLLSGTAISGEMIRLECPGCGTVSGDILSGTGKWMNQVRAVYWDPAESRFVGVAQSAGDLFEEERGVELEFSFYMGGGEQWELWEEYLVFFNGITMPDTLHFPEALISFSFDLPDCPVEGFFLRMIEPYMCPVCGGELQLDFTGYWD